MPGRNNRLLKDLQAFPVLTSELDHTSVQRPSGGGSASSVGQLAEQALREVLAIRPTTANPKSFVAALNNAFTSRDADGRIVWDWTPRSFTVQADLGAVTGAQASIYARAKTMLDHAVLLLDGLDSLRPDADQEDVDSMRAIVRSEILELVNELGMVGGPRVQRVDSLFVALLGANLSTGRIDPETVGGQLGLIRDRFGLSRTRVNTIDEEQNLTNFLILVDHVGALWMSWDSQRDYFSGGSNVFLGTQLVLLARTLEVIAESVHEAESIMDSVFIGPAERQTIRLPFGLDPARQRRVRSVRANGSSPESALTIEELFGWIEYFAVEEGPRVIREAGKDGVVALVPTLERLRTLMQAAVDISSRNFGKLSRSLNGSAQMLPPEGFFSERVRRALRELTGHLNHAFDLANKLRRDPLPTLVAIRPDYGIRGNTERVTVDGTGFASGAVVSLIREGHEPIHAEADTVTVVSPSSINATFDLTDAAPGEWIVAVTNADLSSTLPATNVTFTVEDSDDDDDDDPIEVFDVAEIQFLTSDGRPIAPVRRMGGTLMIDNQDLRFVHVIFNRPLAPDVVTGGDDGNFLVQRAEPGRIGASVGGKVRQVADNAVVFELIDDAGTTGFFAVTLLAEDNPLGRKPIVDKDGYLLNDGKDTSFWFINYPQEQPA
jgi:hypothetical protein